MRKTFKEMKIKVLTPEASEEVQNALFGLGCKWNGDAEGYVQLTSKKALFVDENGKITHMTNADEYFNTHKYPEMFLVNGVFLSAVARDAHEALTTSPVERPPLGLKPRSIHDKLRMLEILEAMHRYVKADKKMPYAWHEEYRELAQQFVEE